MTNIKSACIIRLTNPIWRDKNEQYEKAFYNLSARSLCVNGGADVRTRTDVNSDWTCPRILDKLRNLPCRISSRYEGRNGKHLIYLLIGAAGMGVFSGYEGGIGKLAGPTGGYLIGFILMALICGFVMEKSKGNAVISVIGMIVSTFVAYLFGTVWFVMQMQCDVWYALTVCVFPFIPFDIAKIIIATALCKVLRNVLIKSHLLPEQK